MYIKFSLKKELFHNFDVKSFFSIKFKNLTKLFKFVYYQQSIILARDETAEWLLYRKM